MSAKVRAASVTLSRLVLWDMQKIILYDFLNVNAASARHVRMHPAMNQPDAPQGATNYAAFTMHVASRSLHA